MALKCVLGEVTKDVVVDKPLFGIGFLAKGLGNVQTSRGGWAKALPSVHTMSKSRFLGEKLTNVGDKLQERKGSLKIEDAKEKSPSPGKEEAEQVVLISHEVKEEGS